MFHVSPYMPPPLPIPHQATHPCSCQRDPGELIHLIISFQNLNPSGLLCILRIKSKRLCWFRHDHCHSPSPLLWVPSSLLPASFVMFQSCWALTDLSTTRVASCPITYTTLFSQAAFLLPWFLCPLEHFHSTLKLSSLALLAAPFFCLLSGSCFLGTLFPRHMESQLCGRACHQWARPLGWRALAGGPLAFGETCPIPLFCISRETRGVESIWGSLWIGFHEPFSSEKQILIA